MPVSLDFDEKIKPKFRALKLKSISKSSLISMNILTNLVEIDEIDNDFSLTDDQWKHIGRINGHFLQGFYSKTYAFSQSHREYPGTRLLLRKTEIFIKQ